MKVSAIVSLYNAEPHVRGRLDDLLHQTLYEQGDLEIVVINSGSTDGTRYIIREYLNKITYIESLHEGIYTAWNRGIQIAKGQYITNANADDRFTKPDALEIMAAALDNKPDVGLVYCDAMVVDERNWISDKPPYHGKIVWPEFDPQLLVTAYYGGPSPMWRRELHAKYGMFDDSYQLAADYEFALRLVANGVKFEHISETLIAFADNGIGINNSEYSGMETRRALLKWGRPC